MKNLKINNEENYEHLCNVTLTKEKYPIAFQHKVNELIEDCGLTNEEAEKAVREMSIELEIYYHEGYGLFAVESDFCYSVDEMYSPYNGEKIEKC